MLGVQCTPPNGPGGVIVRMRTSVDGATWSPWYEAPLELGGEDRGRALAFTEVLWTGDGRFVQVGALASSDAAPVALDGVRLIALDTNGGGTVGERMTAGLRKLASTLGGLRLTESAVAAVTQPHLVTRANWGADESLRKSEPAFAPVKMAFVHHSAGGNTYSKDEAAGLVRGIYAYHTVSLGWNDIGYNFLVDRYGTIYEGRAGGPREGVVGAHVYGFNTGSTGVSMIGTYSSEVPPRPAMKLYTGASEWP